MEISFPTPEITAIALLGGYFFGSIPFGLVLTRMAGLGDIRKIGSGSIGATNVLRTGRKDLAVATLVLDSGKGAIAALIAGFLLGPVAGILAGTAAVVGHNFPVWLRFKGGKGVATSLGVLIVIAPAVAGIAFVIWLLVALTTRLSSLSALVAGLAAPTAAWFLASPEVFVAAVFLGALGWIRHRANIVRLLNGTETKINFSRNG